MKDINGAGLFVHDLNDNVVRVLERPDFKREDFTAFPQMLYRMRPNIRTTYKLAGLIEEMFEVESFTAFDAQLTGAQFDDFMSDVALALGSDLTMGGNAAFFALSSGEGRWLPEEKLTEVVMAFSCMYRRDSLTR